MRSLFLLLFLAAGGWLGWVGLRAKPPSYVAPLARAPVSLPAVLPPGEAVRRFAVEGMCCDGCALKLHGRLAAVSGVSAAAIDLGSATASVSARPTVPMDALLAALRAEPKYSVRELP
jgi:copper chaperone CopZ